MNSDSVDEGGMNDQIGLGLMRAGESGCTSEVPLPQPSTEASAATSTPTYCDQLAAFFRARPNTWIDGLEVARIAGAYAWRSRVSEIRKGPWWMAIENRQRREGKRTVSEYRFVPAAERAA